MNEEDKKQGVLTEQYRHFKGIYIERTREYFLCDFYELGFSDGSILYRIKMDLKDKRYIVEMHRSSANAWVFSIPDPLLPQELERQLSEYIENVCLKKSKSSDIEAPNNNLTEKTS